MNLFSDALFRAEIANGLEAGVVGLFFSISGVHKLINKERHNSLVKTLKEDKVPFIAFNQWWVPSVEMIGGISLALGIFPKLAALMLLAICVVACAVDGWKRVEEYHPIDPADRVDDWLYLPEMLYGVILLAILIR